MDERLKKKLELLGEPTLPVRLTAEELFRRMDSGELVLPEEGPLSQTEDDSSRKVIPWVKLMRRGLPIAACLALVVLLSRTGLWDKGFSGGANLSVTSSAPQRAADQNAPAGSDEAPAESYDFDANEDAPDPAPRAIAIEDNAAEEEEVEDADTAAAELARQDGTKNGSQSSLESSDRVEDAFVSDDRVDTDGGSDSGTKHPEPDGRPDSGGGDDDWGHSNPDTGGGYDENDPIYIALMELADQLYSKVDALDGLTADFRGYGCEFDSDGRIAEVTGYIGYVNEDYDTVYFYFLHCRVTWTEDEPQLELIDWGEWDYPSGKGGGPDGGPNGSDGSDGDPNPDTSGGGQNPDISSGDDSDDDKNPDLGAEDKEESDDGDEEAEQDAQGEDGTASESENQDDFEEEINQEL